MAVAGKPELKATKQQRYIYIYIYATVIWRVAMRVGVRSLWEGEALLRRCSCSQRWHRRQKGVTNVPPCFTCQRLCMGRIHYRSPNVQTRRVFILVSFCFCFRLARMYLLSHTGLNFLGGGKGEDRTAPEVNWKTPTEVCWKAAESLVV